MVHSQQHPQEQGTQLIHRRRRPLQETTNNYQPTPTTNYLPTQANYTKPQYTITSEPHRHNPPPQPPIGNRAQRYQAYRPPSAAESAANEIQQKNNPTSRTGKTFVGPWRLGRTLGKGSSGRVRLAKHAETKEVSAIKIISKTVPGVRAAHDQNGNLLIPHILEREVVIMKLIIHPNIITLSDVWENRGELYLVLEYVQGGELFDLLLRNGPLPEYMAMKYFRQLISGLHYCQQFNICHRDLKPENLLLDEYGNLKIADFGMAALQHKGSMLNTSCGSPHYAAPEVVHGRYYNGSQADIWSCGVVLFALLSGTLPFDDGSLRGLLAKVKEGTFDMPSYFSRNSMDLIWLMIQVEPEHRISISDIWDHPLMLQYAPRDPFTGQETDRGPLPPSAKDMRPVRSRSEIDPEMLKNIQTLWNGAHEDKIIDALLTHQPNQEKVFYYLLMKYRSEHLENYPGLLERANNQLNKYTPQIPLRSSQPGSSTSNEAQKYNPHVSQQTLEDGQTTRRTGNSQGQWTETVVHEDNTSSQHQGHHNSSRSERKFQTRQFDDSSSDDYEVPDFSAAGNGHVYTDGILTALTAPRFRSHSSMMSYGSGNSALKFNRPAVKKRQTSIHQGVRHSIRRRRTLVVRNSTEPNDWFARGRQLNRDETPTEDLNGMDHFAPHSRKEASNRWTTVIDGEIVQAQMGVKTSVPMQQRVSGIREEDAERRQASIALEKLCEESFNSTSGPGSSPLQDTMFECSAGHFNSPVTGSPTTSPFDYAMSSPSPVAGFQAPPSSPTIENRDKTLPRLPIEAMPVRNYLGQVNDSNSNYLDDVLASLDQIIVANEDTAVTIPSDQRRAASEGCPPFCSMVKSDDLPHIFAQDFEKHAADINQPISAKHNQGDRTVSAPHERVSNVIYEDLRNNDMESGSGADNASTKSDTSLPIPPTEPLRIRRRNIPRIIEIRSHANQRSAIPFGGAEADWYTAKNGHQQTENAPIKPTTFEEIVPPQNSDPAPLAVPQPEVKKKRSIFGLGKRNKVEEVSGPVSGGNANNLAVAKVEGDRTLTGKKSFLSLWINKDAKKAKADNNDVDKPVQDNHLTSCFAALDYDSDGGVASKETTKNDDQTTQVEQKDEFRRVLRGQNWFRRAFHVKPASRIICMRIPAFQTRREILKIWRQWAAHGLVLTEDSRKHLVLRARVGSPNTLNIKEVSFVAEVRTYSGSRRCGLGVVRFTQEKGAASSFHRVVDEIARQFTERNIIVERPESIALMSQAFAR